jgi:hypothetical protein
MHTSEWHITDSNFPTSNAGLAVPRRTTSHASARLAIENLDRADPPDYVAGGVPRGVAFNRNTFRLTGTPCMPEIPVKCSVAGFDPATTPILWRLVCRHVLCRHFNTGSFQYRGACEAFQLEWRGESRAATFTLFAGAASGCSCTYNDESRVLGGHALLLVAAVLPDCTLQDYVQLRIAGTNPTQADVFRYLDVQLAEYDANIVHMVRAIFQHESAFTQFATGPQSAAAMTFRRPHHKDPAQPECRVRFDWPDDPPNFPLASFDFGVGISQFTRVGNQRISADIAWDWRENVRLGTNLFLAKLKKRRQPGMSWRHWALAGWSAYNGSGPAAEAYAKSLSMSTEGAQIAFSEISTVPQMALLAPPPPLDGPAPWVVV